MHTAVLSAEDIRKMVPMADAIEAVREAFVALERGEFDMPERTVLGDGQFLVMSAQHRPSGTAMVKVLSVNFERSPAIGGTVTWSELDRTDVLVADAGAVTTLRTGAIVGVATDLLADDDADRLVLIGAGAQAADQVRAVHAVRPLRQLTVVDLDPHRAASLLRSLAHEMPEVALRTASDADVAVSEADIVCCATTARTALFHAESLPSRVHVNAIGSFRPWMRELPRELLSDAPVVVDDRAAVLEEAGEIIDAVEAGVLAAHSLVGLGAALSGRPATAPRTVFKTVGIAVQDWAIAHSLARQHLA